MSTDTVVRARIDSDTKTRATEALKAMGLTVSDAIRLLLLRVSGREATALYRPGAEPSHPRGHERAEGGQGPAFRQR